MSEVPLHMGYLAHQELPPPTRTLQNRGTSLIRKRIPVGPFSSPIPRAVWWS
jgi:hypothetical protein